MNLVLVQKPKTEIRQSKADMILKKREERQTGIKNLEEPIYRATLDCRQLNSCILCPTRVVFLQNQMWQDF